MAFEDGDNQEGAAGGAADLLGGSSASDDQQQGGGDDGAGGSGGEGGEGGSSEADPSWYENLSAEADGESASNRDWIKTKGFKDLDSFAKAYRAAEKAIYDSGRIKIPGEGATAEEVAAFHKALGVPESPQGYEFKAPMGDDGKPIALDQGVLSRIAESAHKSGVPKAAAEALVADYIQGELDQLATAQRELDAQAQSWVKAQGGEANAKIAAVDRAARALDLSKEDMQALRAAWGPEKALNIMARLGEGMAEDTLIGGGAGKFGVTGAQAQAEIDRLTKDAEFMAKVRVKGSAEEARWKRLNDAAGEAANRAAALA